MEISEVDYSILAVRILTRFNPGENEEEFFYSRFAKARISDPAINETEFINSERILTTRIIKYGKLEAIILQKLFIYRDFIKERNGGKWPLKRTGTEPNASPSNLSITPMIEQPKTAQLFEKLQAYGFENYLIENDIKKAGIIKLIKSHSGKEFVPYSIALLYSIGFLERFFDEYTKTKEEGFKKLAKVFDSHVRRIKGNVNILKNPNSKENKEEYGSWTYIESIQNELSQST